MTSKKLIIPENLPVVQFSSNVHDLKTTHIIYPILFLYVLSKILDVLFLVRLPSCSTIGQFIRLQISFLFNHWSVYQTLDWLPVLPLVNSSDSRSASCSTIGKFIRLQIGFLFYHWSAYQTLDRLPVLPLFSLSDFRSASCSTIGQFIRLQIGFLFYHWSVYQTQVCLSVLVYYIEMAFSFIVILHFIIFSFVIYTDALLM